MGTRLGNQKESFKPLEWRGKNLVSRTRIPCRVRWGFWLKTGFTGRKFQNPLNPLERMGRIMGGPIPSGASVPGAESPSGGDERFWFSEMQNRENPLQGLKDSVARIGG